MAKKMYTSPLFLKDEGDHTQPYSNSQDITTPDGPIHTIPDLSLLSDEQMADVLTLSVAEMNAMDTDHSGSISVDEYYARFPQVSDTPDPE